MTPTEQDKELREQTRKSIARLIAIQRGDDTWNNDDYITAGNILIACHAYREAYAEKRVEQAARKIQAVIDDHKGLNTDLSVLKLVETSLPMLSLLTKEAELTKQKEEM